MGLTVIGRDIPILAAVCRVGITDVANAGWKTAAFELVLFSKSSVAPKFQILEVNNVSKNYSNYSNYSSNYSYSKSRV